MNTRNGITTHRILTVSAVLFFSTFVFAHGSEQHVMGTVTKIQEGSIVVNTKEGDTKTVMVTPTTKFVKGTATATQKDLRVGDRVVIHAAPMGEMLHATEVKIGNAPKGAEPH
jgi:hypothetical protein